MNSREINKKLGIVLIAFILIGVFFNVLYTLSPRHIIDTDKTKTEISQKQLQAEEMLEKLQRIVSKGSLTDIYKYNFPDIPTTYFILKKDSAIFWSRNYVDFRLLSLPANSHWNYILLPNAHCICKVINHKGYRLAALIKIKNNFPFENEQLQNTYAQGINLEKNVGIKIGKSTDTYAISGRNKDYLFSLTEPASPVYNQRYGTIAMWAYLFAFLLIFILYARIPYFFNRKNISITSFTYSFLFMGAFVLLCLRMNFPGVLFQNTSYAPFLYASNPALGSLTHLTIFTSFLLSSLVLLYFNTIIYTGRRVLLHYTLLFAYGFYFCIFYYFLLGIVNHSDVQISILSFHDINLTNIWIHVLILVFAIGQTLLFFKSHSWFNNSNKLKNAYLIDLVLTIIIFVYFMTFGEREAFRASVSYVLISLSFYLRYYFPKVKHNFGFLVLWAFCFSCFFTINSLFINNYRKAEKFKVLAQNIAVNGNSDNDKMADILLEDLDKEITSDTIINQLITNSDSIQRASDYLNATYLRGFWNKYEVRLNVTYEHSNVHREYKKFIENAGTHMKNTHFYSVPANESSMSYIAAFSAPKPNRRERVVYFMEFYPRRNFRSYSFPDLLVASTPSIQEKLKISIAKYERNRLVYSTGNYVYPLENDWIKRKSPEFFDKIYNGKLHHIFVANQDTYIVLTEEEPYNPINYLLYLIYIFLAFYAVSWSIVWISLIVTKKQHHRLGLSTRFQYSFISLLLISFLSIFYVSVNYIERKYRQEQISNLENKKAYIQKALQDRYYWNQELNDQNTQSLNFDLQDLSSVYHTDIHVYNNQGILVGSSQPLLFGKNLMSNHISPKPFFSHNPNMNQYEHLGNLEYLTGYTEFINGDYVQIGYIAIPKFYSQDEIHTEIEDFLTVVTHIYIIILVFSIILSLIIGKQLAAPLIMLENKLRDMRLGRRNEKIEYNQNDEISQLVKQYNRTIDELEQSARLLAKSERETAWKSMARQVAHEINNPLTPMKLSIQQLQRTKRLHDARFDDYFDRSTQMLIEQIDNLSRIAGTFSSFARMPEANFSRVDIAARLSSVVQLFSNNNENIRIQYEGADNNVFVFADGEQLVQVFNNLIKNAIQAIPENKKGYIMVRLMKENDIHIEVEDNGSGVDDELKDKLFTPNFTTKRTGMGLGLAICKNIIEVTGGTISFRSTKDVGTTFIITLPEG